MEEYYNDHEFTDEDEEIYTTSLFSKMKRGLLFPFKVLLGGYNFTKKIITAGCAVIVLIAVLILITVVFRPPFLWNPTKNFLNQSSKPIDYSNIKTEDIYEEINSVDQMETVLISEADLSKLIDNKLDIDADTFATIEDKTITIFLNIESDNNPLWLAISLEDKDSALNLKRVGFKRFALPYSFTNSINEHLEGVLSFIRKDTLEEFTKELLDFSEIDSDIKIELCELEKNMLVLNISKEEDQ